MIKNRFKDRYASVYIFILLALFEMIFLSSIQAYGIGRKDYVVYSRYFDFTTSPIVLFSLINIEKLSLKHCKMIVAVTFLAEVIEFYIIDYISTISAPFNYVCSPIFGGIFLLNQNNSLSPKIEINKWEVLKYSSLLCLLICFLIVEYSSIRKTRYVVMVVIIMLNIGLGDIITNRVCSWRNEMSADAYELMKLIPSDASLYYINQDDSTDFINMLKEYQYMEDNSEINSCTIDDIDLILKNNAYIVSNKSIYETKCRFIYMGKRCVLYANLYQILCVGVVC